MAKNQYQLLRGTHQDATGTHEPGAIVESEIDLVAKQGADRWRRVSSNFTSPASSQPSVPPTQVPKVEDDGLDELTVAELRQYAEENELDLSGKSRKDEIVQAIRDQLGEQ